MIYPNFHSKHKPENAFWDPLDFSLEGCSLLSRRCCCWNCNTAVVPTRNAQQFQTFSRFRCLRFILVLKITKYYFRKRNSQKIKCWWKWCPLWNAVWPWPLWLVWLVQVCCILKLWAVETVYLKEFKEI